MPIGSYFKGKGTEVMADMKSRYGGRGKEVFYATANKRGLKPGGGGHKKAKGFDRLAAGKR